MPWYSVLPFAGLLACIAILPLLSLTKHAWEKPSVKLAVALFFGLPMAVVTWQAGHHHGVMHAVIEYGQFICLLGSLFIISGGINVDGDIQATPGKNVVFLAIGGTLASFIGTTGAAMLMIRPLCKTISERKFKAHTVIFAIFIVANCGGLLTPLGDPPLFLGMLRGVPFTWTFSLLPQWLFVNGLLLLTYYALDRQLYAKEPMENILWDAENITPITIQGKHNFGFLLIIVLSVAFIPTPYREFMMLLTAIVSYSCTNARVRKANGFNWEPILEVATLFIGIFLAMVPALIYLRGVAPSLPLNEFTFFIFTGGLSAVLDNAPTYVTFFEISKGLGGGHHHLVAGVPVMTLTAISLGSVFGGAITYIGNGPNFMVKSVAESMGVRMPSFGGYVYWSFRTLVPILVLMMLIFISSSLTLKSVGMFLAACIFAVRLWQIRRYPHPSFVTAKVMQTSSS